MSNIEFCGFVPKFDCKGDVPLHLATQEEIIDTLVDEVLKREKERRRNDPTKHSTTVSRKKAANEHTKRKERRGEAGSHDKNRANTGAY